MALAAQFPGDVLVLGNLQYTGSLIGPGGGINRSALAIDTVQSYQIPWGAFQVWDAVGVPLPGDGQIEECVSNASYFWDANSADNSFFVAGRAYRVVGITSRVEVAGTDGSAVTAIIKKAASGTAIASGTALHTSTINLKGTAATNQSLSLSATSTDLDIASGTCIGIDFTGTLTTAKGCVTVALAPAPSADDLKIVGGTFATGVPSLQTGDLKNAGATTKYARFQVQLPPEYVTGTSITLRLHAGMLTTVASASATLAASAYKSGKEVLVSGSDLVTTSATNINSTTLANYDFAITGTGLVAGDMLDIRVAVAVNDSATVTAVIGCIGHAEMLLSIRG